MLDEHRGKIAQTLLLLRLALGYVLVQGLMERFVAVFVAGEAYNFYGVPVSFEWMITLFAMELFLSMSFIVGFWQGFTYFVVFTIQVVDVGSEVQRLPNPFLGMNEVLAAGAPLLAAYWVMFVLRELDTISLDMWRLDRKQRRSAIKESSKIRRKKKNA